jgi:three-Cys-motif partner protein
MIEEHKFGGDWTEEKLKRLEKYLKAYAVIMNNQPFGFDYIDAFAGTGYIEGKKHKIEDQVCLFRQNDMREIGAYLRGSARIALEIAPEFHKYIFIDKSKRYCAELLKLKEEFKSTGKKIYLINADANDWLVDYCNNYKWQYNRAVLFLDPYGMQVNWETVVAIANTKSIDLWYLFPLGIGVNRLLKKDIRKMPASWEKRLDSIFGTNEWKEAFYGAKHETTLFGNETRIVKDTDFSKISQFVVKRLKSVFAGVADNPLLLCNSKNNPLYLLCFASGNPRGAPTAIKIAQYILKR